MIGQRKRVSQCAHKNAAREYLWVGCYCYTCADCGTDVAVTLAGPLLPSGEYREGDFNGEHDQ